MHTDTTAPAPETTAETPEPAPETSTPENTKTADPVSIEEKRHRPLHVAGAVFLALAIVGGALYFVYTNYYAEGGVVAVVNGTKIYREELEETKAVLRDNASFYGIDAAAPGAEDVIGAQSLELLITAALIATAAEAENFAVTDADIESTYQSLIVAVGGEENLRSQMASAGLTDEKLRRNIRRQELINRYLEAKTDIGSVTVSDEEVAALIAALQAGNVELPPIEEIRPQLEAQIKAEKEQELLNTLVENLRATADIEKRI